MRLKLIAALMAAVFLAGCDPEGIPPETRLPQVPADIQRCFDQSGVNIPRRPLTVAEVERLWKTDRVRIVVMQRCGNRLLAWYSDLRDRWH